jgi:hypothetical protein
MYRQKPYFITEEKYQEILPRVHKLEAKNKKKENLKSFYNISSEKLA